MGWDGTLSGRNIEIELWVVDEGDGMVMDWSWDGM